MLHLDYMYQAIALGKKARYQAPPNPWVGCVIVKDNQIIGKGWTQPPGQAHAEVCALAEAREQAQGASLYVSLEPCAHFGRTPPCVNAIIQAGISEIFIAVQDPDSKVQGKGIAQLKAHGIQVSVGLCEEEARLSLLPYIYHRQTGFPYTIVKAAVSMDGRIAAQDGSSQWISSPEARQDAHLLRAGSQAVMIGSETALRDHPQLNVRHPNPPTTKQPLRVIMDTRGRVPAQGALFDQRIAPTLVLTTDLVSVERIKEWQDRGAEVVILPLSDQKIDLMSAWKYLGERGIVQLLVEGGAMLQTQLIKKQLINELTLYMGSLLLGAKGIPFYLESVQTLSEAPQFSLKAIQQIGNCVRIDYIR